MRKILLSLAVLGAIVVPLLQAAPAQAPATRTWVSGVGDDANPCSRTAPCKTFAGAISKTAAGGEISVLDPGGFGAVTITKAITLSGDGTLAGILNAGSNGVIVNAGVNDTVVLRNLSISGAGTGTNGIRFLSGAELVVDKCTIYGQTGTGIDVSLAASGNLMVRDTNISGGAKGVRLATTAGYVTGSLDNVRVDQASTSGVEIAANNGSTVAISRSIISNTVGNAVFTTGGGGLVYIDGSSLLNNVTALNASVSGSFINVSDSNIYANSTGFSFVGGATIASTGNNRTANNGGASIPNGTIQLR